MLSIDVEIKKMGSVVIVVVIATVIVVIIVIVIASVIFSVSGMQRNAASQPARVSQCELID